MIGFLRRRAVKFMTTQHLSGCLVMPYVHPALNADSKSKYLAPQGERPSAYQISPAPSCQDPFSRASISPGSLLSQMRLEKALWVMICHHLFAYGAWHLMAPERHTHVCMCARGCSPASGHWADWPDWALFTGYDINMINGEEAMDSCWRVISDILDDFALIRQLSFGKMFQLYLAYFCLIKYALEWEFWLN